MQQGLFFVLSYCTACLYLAGMAEEIRLIDRLESLDREVKNWALLTRDRLHRRIMSLGLHGRMRVHESLKRMDDDDSLEDSIGFYVKRFQGDIDAVAFTFVRHGIFIEHGVGRGRPVRSAQANLHKKPWLSAVLPGSVQDLADILAEEYADIAANDLRILIPGIIDTTIRK